MIPDGTSPNEIILAIALTLLAFSLFAVWLFWHRLPPGLRHIMSRLVGVGRSDRGVAPPVATTPREPRQPIATPGNNDNAGLPGNAVADALPSEVRDIIRMQAKAEVVADLLKGVKFTNKAEAIEFVFHCSRSGRPNSPYQQALALVDPLIDKYPNRTPDQEQARRELELA